MQAKMDDRMNSKKNVGIYCRTSTNELKQIKSLDNQVRELTEYVQNNPEWILTNTYIDKGKSGCSENKRDEYQRMLSDIENEQIQIIIIKDIDRLVRNVNSWNKFKNLINLHKVKLFVYLENDYLSDDNMLIMDEKARYAEYFSKDLSYKLNSSVKRAQKDGTVYSNGLMLGYNQKDGKLTINEDEAVIVRQIFQWYIDGLGFYKISNKLDEIGIKSSTGTKFSQSTLKRMIRQEKYRGMLVSGKFKTDFETHTVSAVPDAERIYIEDGCPRIVSDEIWFKANETLNSRRVTNEMNKVVGIYKGNKYPLSGKIICGKCGKSYWHSSYTTKVNKLHRNVWNCSTYRSQGTKGCQNTILQDEVIMELTRSIVINNCGDLQYETDKCICEVIDKIVVTDNDIIFYLNKGLQREVHYSLSSDMECDKHDK